MATIASETANADKLNTKIEEELLADISTDEADWKAATEIREKDAAPLQSTCCSAPCPFSTKWVVVLHQCCS